MLYIYHSAAMVHAVYLLTKKISSKSKHLVKSEWTLSEQWSQLWWGLAWLWQRDDASKCGGTAWHLSLLRLSSLFIHLGKSEDWSPNNLDSLLVTLGLASNVQQQQDPHDPHTNSPSCWDGPKRAAGSSMASSCTPMTAWSAPCPFFLGVCYERTFHRNMELVAWLFRANYLNSHSGNRRRSKRKE